MTTSYRCNKTVADLHRRSDTAPALHPPVNLRALYRRHYFVTHVLRPTLGVAVTVPLGVAVTFLIAEAAGWLR